MYPEADLLPVSALADLAYCERRAALHYLEGIWHDNVFTVEGSHLHDRVHQAESETRGGVRIARGLHLRSLRLGLTGKADVVEFHLLPDGADKNTGIHIQGASGIWQPFPVEYKRGRLRREHGYELQLCAQALCLEEMLNVEIPAGALFYGKTRRRLEVGFDKTLRAQTEAAAVRLHELARSGKTPRAKFDKKCKKCSLLDSCLPKATGGRRSADKYFSAAIAALTAEGEGD